MKLRVHMGALTRMQCTKEIEVPDDLPENEWSDVVRATYDETEGDEFKQDYDFWERGECWCEKVKDE